MLKVIQLFFLLCTVTLHGQKTIDSILSVANSSTNDSTKIALYNKVSWYYIFREAPKADSLLAITFPITQHKNQQYGYTSWLNVKGVYYDVTGTPDSAYVYFKQALALSKQHQFVDHYKHSLNNLGMYCWNNGLNQEALSYFFKTLKEEEKQNPPDQRGLATTLNNIGLIYQEMDLYEKAINYHEQALKKRIALNDENGQLASYNNLGICFENLLQYEKALNHYNKGVQLAKTIHNNTEYYALLNGLGSIYFKLKRPKVALQYYLESYQRPETVGFNTKSKIHTLSNISSIYAELGNADKAISYGKLCLQELEKIDDEEVVEVAIYNALAQAYFLKGNIAEGNKFNQEFYTKTTLKFKAENAKAIQELETKYQTEKKEKLLAEEQLKVTAKELKIQHKNTWLLVLAISTFLILLLAYMVFKNQKSKQKQLQQEKDLTEALLKIEHNKRLEEQRIAISRDLHDNIGAQLTFIISSLDSVKMFLDTTETVLQHKIATVSEFTRNTIQELRDTIWAMHKESISIEDLQTRISNFLATARASKHTINFTFTSTIDDDDFHAFSSKVGMNLYRIMQEGVNNSIKHAQAKTVHVHFAVDKTVTISIKDDGIGIPQNTKEGNGLVSMRKRAKEIGASLSIITKNGSAIMVSIPNK